MRIGICGAHRTGKTTLAAKYAALNGVEFVQPSVSQVFAELGFPVDHTLSAAQRMQVQNAVLDRYRQATGAARSFVTDRTPVDFIAYTLSNLTQDDFADKELELQVSKYINECVMAAAKSLDMLILVRPAIAIVPADGKGLLSAVYMKKIDTMIIGVLTTLGVRYAILPTDVVQLDKRVEWLQSAIRS